MTSYALRINKDFTEKELFELNLEEGVGVS